MRQLVSINELDEVIEDLHNHSLLFLDTETTGLRPHHGDRLFALIIATEDRTYYFNFYTYEDVADEFSLIEEDFQKLLPIFSDEQKRWVIHNAKFDLGMLRVEGVHVAGKIHCTMTMERILKSDLMPGFFSLDSVSKRYGTHKIDKVKEYIDKNRLWEEYILPGSKEVVKHKRYQDVPFEMMYEYACQDVESLRVIYKGQMESLHKLTVSAPPGLPPLTAVYVEEMLLIKTVFEIEWRGIRCDKRFCEMAMLHYKEEMATAKALFRDQTAREFVDSAKLLAEVFEADKENWTYGAPTKKKGLINPKFDSETIARFAGDTPAAVLRYRDALSAYNFYAGFIDAMDPRGFIHTNLNQHGTKTGRFSSSNPNLQNMTNEEGEALLEEFVVRRAVIPREGNVFHMIDYVSMEYVVMFDYAGRFVRNGYGVQKLIELVKSGYDVHQATADLVNISRKDAKTVNFALIFGAGDKLLGKNLKSTQQRAKQLRNAIFSSAPEIEQLIERTRDTAAARGYVVTWKGRINRVAGDKAFRATNYLIQGGSADVVKTAMNNVERFLKPYETKMVLMIHDELVLDGPASEAQRVVPEVCRIMSDAFPGRFLKLRVDVEHSSTSLADKTKGVANGQI